MHVVVHQNGGCVSDDDDDYDDDDDDDGDDDVDGGDGLPIVGELVVVSGHREKTVPKLTANCFAESQNLGGC